MRPGYKRKATVPASLGKPEAGPHFDEIDEHSASLSRDIYQRLINRRQSDASAERQMPLSSATKIHIAKTVLFRFMCRQDYHFPTRCSH